MIVRVLLLVSTTSYRTEDFLRAAERMQVEVVVGTDRCHILADEWPREAFGGSLQLEFRDPEAAVREIVADAKQKPYTAVVATDEQTAVLAAMASRALSLRGNSIDASYAAKNKHSLRRKLVEHGVPTPACQVFEKISDPTEVARMVRFPCVLKPLLLSTSRGVIRADDPISFEAAWKRIVSILGEPAQKAVEDSAGHQILVEDYVDGAEVAFEGILDDGRLIPLALFDKPDPLEGPFFEETLYITPSRHPPEVQEKVAATLQRAARAMGLREGPIHAELRLAADGPSVIEVAARSIGGLCARTLRFGLGEHALEEIVLRQALGRGVGAIERKGAAGVMMLPIPAAGILQQVEGVEDARAIRLVEDVVITVELGRVLVPLPEGSTYLGFIFARGKEPDEVEAALRRAHASLRFAVRPHYSAHPC